MSEHLRRRPRRRRVDMSTRDLAFDKLVPADLRHLSQTHWTPIDVAIRVAKLLGATRDMRILDVGSGVGKVCSIGALSSLASWFGVEKHELLVETAQRLARGFGVTARTTFIHGDAFSIDWGAFDALYLYNPFELPLFPDRVSSVAQEIDFRVQVMRVEERLAELRAGTRVVTLHGFGGVMPASYDLVYQERLPVVGLDLVSWVQRTRSRRAPESS